MQALLQIVDMALADVERGAPNRFRSQIRGEAALAGQYLAICRLGYAAGSKELRDTSDEQVHAALDRLANAIHALDALARIRLSPADADQRATWRACCEALPGGRLLPRDDGSLECLLLDAALDDAPSLHARRIWSEVSNSDGTEAALRLPLTRSQAVRVRASLAVLQGELPYPFAAPR